MQTNNRSQFPPEFITECILKLEDGIKEKENIFNLLKIQSTVETSTRYVFTGVDPNRKNFKKDVAKVWIEEEKLEKGLRKTTSNKKLHSLISKIKSLDKDVNELVLNAPRTANELIETYFKKHYLPTKNVQSHEEATTIIKKHFIRDVPENVIRTILNITEEEKAVLMDEHYKKEISSYQGYTQSLPPHREEYISDEEFQVLQKRIWWCAWNKTVRKKQSMQSVFKNYLKRKKLKMVNKELGKTDSFRQFTKDLNLEDIQEETEDYNFRDFLIQNQLKIIPKDVRGYDVEPDIDYKSLYQDEIKALEAKSWKDVFEGMDTYENTYMPDDLVEMYMKKFNPELYFKSKIKY